VKERKKQVFYLLGGRGVVRIASAFREEKRGSRKKGEGREKDSIIPQEEKTLNP